MFLMIKQWQKHCPFVVCSRCPYSTAAPESTAAKPTFYEVLNVSETANLAEIKSAFIKKSKESHPDINPNRPELHDTFVQINEAYNVLCNASSRYNYDLKLKRTSSSRSRSVASDSVSDPFGSVPRQQKQSSHHYHDSTHFSTYYRQGGRPYNVAKPVMNAEKARNNKLIVIGACAFMLTGAIVHYVLLRYRHKRYKAQLEESNRKANKLHREARERARINGLKGQLEQLIHVSQNSGVDKVAAVKSLQDFYGEKKMDNDAAFT